MKKMIMKFISRIPLLRYIYNVIVDARIEHRFRKEDAQRKRELATSLHDAMQRQLRGVPCTNIIYNVNPHDGMAQVTRRPMPGALRTITFKL